MSRSSDLAAATAPLTGPTARVRDPAAHLRQLPLPRPLGWPVAGGGRAANVDGGCLFQATTAQTCGLYPFAIGAGAAPPGVPVGRHMLTAEPVGLDPAAYLHDGLVSNLGMWVQGQPGIGKSTIVKRLLLGLVGFGFRAVICGDVKGEYSRLVEHLGGRVWKIGRGLHALNPLDAGPIGAVLPHTSGRERERLTDTLRSRRLSLLEALVVIVRRGEVMVTDRRLLGAALDLAVAATAPGAQPTIPDVLRVLTTPTAELLSISACPDVGDYRRDSRDLINTLGLVCAGPLRGLFDRPSTVYADPDSVALSLDLSALDEDDDQVVAAAMMASWTWAASLIEATTVLGRRRNVLRIQDELWRALRVAPGLVERADQVTRLGRHRGEVSVQVTHSLDDLEALPSAADRAKARGLAARNATVVLGGMPDKELDGLRRICPITEEEASLVRSWAAPATWNRRQVHPGRGKYLIKCGERIGLPVAMSLVGPERTLYDTDQAWRPR